MATYGQINRQMYEDYIRNFRPYEEQILASTDDTTLIDRAQSEAEAQSRIAGEVQQRNLSRYGGQGLLTPVERAEREKALALGGATNLTGALNQARLYQKDINFQTLSDVIGVGQGVLQSAMGGLADVNAMRAQREQAYQNARAQNSANMASLGAQLGTTALLAFGI